MKTMRQPTGEDVARVAGVSKSAVSRAFTGGSVSDDARERILDAARKLKYRPSHLARSLKTNRSRLVGLAVTHLDNHFYPEVIQLISDEIARRGSRIVLFITRGETRLEPMLDEFLGFGLDGIIFASGPVAVEVARECVAAAMPVMMLNNVDTSNTVPGVSTDNELGGRAVAEHFLDRGHRKVAVMTGVEGSSTSKERSEAFKARIAQAGIAVSLEVCGHYTPEGAREAMNLLLDQEVPPTALFCVNDHMAFTAIEVCRARGVEPGRDIAICGFDDVAIASWQPFSLSSYAQPVDAMVEDCVSRLFRQIDGQDIPAETSHFEGRLNIRASSDFNL